MNKNIKLSIIIIILLALLFIAYYIWANIIKGQFLIKEVQIYKDELRKEKYLSNKERFLSINLFKNMPYKYKEDFLNNSEQYDCYHLLIDVKNNSKYNADQILIKYKNNIKDLWVDEECGTMVPDAVKSHSKTDISTGIICKKGALENKKIDLDLIFYTNCLILEKFQISY